MRKVQKFLITTIMCLGLFGIMRAEEVTVAGVTVNGEFSTDMTFGEESNEFSNVYTGLSFSGEGWTLSTNLTDGMVNVEEAKYSWNVVDGVSLTFGSQAEPYGLAWGLHRPSNNWFVSSPRDHSIYNGVGVDVDKWGVGIQALYAGGEDDYWATRLSYSLSALEVEWNIGLSLNSNEAQLVDASFTGNMFDVSFEYDLSEEADGAYWTRGVVTPSTFQGAFLLIGYNSEEEVLYGVGYKCSDSFKVATEFSSEDEDGSDVVIRASYSF